MNVPILHESSRGISTYSVESSLLQRRILFFNEEVNAVSSIQLIEHMLYLEADDPDGEITVCINSPGGEVVSGLTVYDAMRMLKCPIRTVCTGMAASMASIIFMGGDKREMLDHTKIMIHDPLISQPAGTKKALDLEKEAERLMEARSVLAGIIAERCGRSIEEVLEKTREDCFMDVKQAMEFGIATGVCEHI